MCFGEECGPDIAITWKLKHLRKGKTIFFKFEGIVFYVFPESLNDGVFSITNVSSNWGLYKFCNVPFLFQF